MKKRLLFVMCAGVLSLDLLAFASHAEAPRSLLPLERVRLYEVGVGYFERKGVLSDHSDLGLSLPQSQLDDALSSLVIVGGAGKARVASIEFEARESTELARAEASLSSDPAAPLAFASVLKSFRGADVEATQRGTRVRGRLVDVIPLDQASAERCVSPTSQPAGPETAAATPALPCNETRDANLVLLGNDGTLSRLRLTQVESVRALDATVAARLSRALAAVSHQSAVSGRKILHIHGAGSAALTLGYVAEAPVWRASYRLVLGEGAQVSIIQGFALIHNDTDEAWRSVKLELVNGRPSSFLYPLAAPRYVHRELVTPEEQLSTVPQLLSQNADDLWRGDTEEAEGAGGTGLQGYGAGGGGRGEGIGLGSVGTVGHGAGTSDVLDVGALTSLNTATGVEGAAQFLYALAAGVDLSAHASALVPFVEQPLEITRITWFDDGDGVAETAVRLVNSSQQTLPAGALSVFADAGFSGASLLPRTKPGETRVLRFGRDLDVTLARRQRELSVVPQLYAFDGSQLSEHSLRSSRVECALRNKSRSDRQVSVALQIVANARVEGADEAAYDNALGRAVVSFRLPAGSGAQRELHITEGIVTRIPEARADSAFLKRAALQGAVPRGQRLILARAADARYGAEIRRGALPKRKAEIAEALADATRLESHVRALTSSSDEGQLAAQRLRQTEDRLSLLRQRVRALESEIQDYEARARSTLDELGPASPLELERGLPGSADDDG